MDEFLIKMRKFDDARFALLTCIANFILKSDLTYGGRRWIRTIVDVVNGFTVRPL